MHCLHDVYKLNSYKIPYLATHPSPYFSSRAARQVLIIFDIGDPYRGI